MTQTIRGFLQSSTSHVAAMTHIVGSGARNATERCCSTGARIATDPFAGDDRTGRVGPGLVQSDLRRELADARHGSGTPATAKRSRRGRPHATTSPYDCSAWAAVIFSTAVQDTDGDGLPDKLEDVSGLKDPTGQLAAGPPRHGRELAHKDLFVEIGAMKADPGTTYGSADAPLARTPPRWWTRPGTTTCRRRRS